MANPAWQPASLESEVGTSLSTYSPMTSVMSSDKISKKIQPSREEYFVGDQELSKIHQDSSILGIPQNKQPHRIRKTHQQHWETAANRDTGSGMAAKQYFECCYCNNKFTSKESCGRHVRRHRGLYRFFCDICNKGFMNKLDCEGHTNVHLNVRPYSCEFCERSFHHKKNYVAHRRKSHMNT